MSFDGCGFGTMRGGMNKGWLLITWAYADGDSDTAMNVDQDGAGRDEEEGW